jgi:hypothetical protein
VINAKFEYLEGTKDDPYVASPLPHGVFAYNWCVTQDRTMDRALAWNFLFGFCNLGTSWTVGISLSDDL